MKAIFLLLLTLLSFTLHGQGDAPPILQGQAQTTKSVAATIELPNNQATKTTSSKALIETGNNNILANPGFEHLTFNTGWTCDRTPTAETTIRLGKKSLKLSLTAQSFECYQDSTVDAAYLVGSNLVASGKINTNFAGAYICSRNAGVTSTTNCAEVNTDGTFKFPTAVPFIGSATSNGISITSKGVSVTGTLYADQMDLSPLSFITQDQSALAGESYFGPNAACDQTRTSTSMGAFGTDVDCIAPTITRSTIGTWLTTDSDGAIQIINNLKSGQYEAEFEFAAYNSVNNNAGWAINDGTTTCNATGGAGGTAVTAKNVSCSFYYAVAGNRTYQLHALVGAGTLHISNDSGGGGVRFKLRYLGSGQTYTQGGPREILFTANTIASTVITSANAGTTILKPTVVVNDTANGYNASTGEYTLPESGTYTMLAGTDMTIASGMQGLAWYINGTAKRWGPAVYGITNQAQESYYKYKGVKGDIISLRTIQLSGSTTATWGNNNTTGDLVIIAKDFTPSMVTALFKEVKTSPGITKPKECSVMNAGATVSTLCSASPCTEYADSCNTATPAVWNSAGTYTVVWAAGTWLPNVPIRCGVNAAHRSSWAGAGPGTSAVHTDASGGFTLTVYGVSAAYGTQNTYFNSWCEADSQ